jgi:hypothetical protein
MKSYLLLVSLAFIFASCSTAYKTGQTPDDVYYSPERSSDEYVRVEKRNDRQYRNDDNYEEERYVRMKVRNRLYSVLDDEWYRYDSYSRYNTGYMSCTSPWNYANYWNYYYNPYGKSYVTVSPVGSSAGIYNKPRFSNLLVFDRDLNNNNSAIPKGYRGSSVKYKDNTENYRSSGTNAGNFLRDAFGTSSTSSSKPAASSSSPSTSSGSSSSSSSSSSGSSSAPVRKF